MKDINTNIFRDLAVLTEAGISIADAARRMHTPQLKLAQWDKLVRALDAGRGFSDALGASGLITRDEQQVIAAAEFAGRLPQGLRQIADSYEMRVRRISRVKAQLYYPMAVLLVGIVVMAILDLVKDPPLAVWWVLLKSFFWAALMVLLTRFIVQSLQKDACAWLKMLYPLANSRWYRQHFELVVGRALLWAGRSGIDFKTALLKVSRLIDVAAIQKKLRQASAYCGQGMALSDSLSKVELPLTTEYKQVSRTGEFSGRWEEATEKYLDQQAQLLQLQIDTLFEWIPRLYYVVVVLVVLQVVF